MNISIELTKREIEILAKAMSTPILTRFLNEPDRLEFESLAQFFNELNEVDNE